MPRSLERRQSLRRGVGMEVLLAQITQTADRVRQTALSAALRETEPIAIINSVHTLSGIPQSLVPPGAAEAESPRRPKTAVLGTWPGSSGGRAQP